MALSIRNNEKFLGIAGDRGGKAEIIHLHEEASNDTYYADMFWSALGGFIEVST